MRWNSVHLMNVVLEYFFDGAEIGRAVEARIKHTNHTTWRIDPDRSWCVTVDARHTNRTSESAFDIDHTSMAFERRRFEDDEPNCFCCWKCSDSSRIDIESPNESIRCDTWDRASFHTIYHIGCIRIVLLLTKQQQERVPNDKVLVVRFEKVVVDHSTWGCHHLQSLWSIEFCIASIVDDVVDYQLRWTSFDRLHRRSCELCREE